MSSNNRHVPAGSQTVGPFFRIGLDYLVDRTAQEDARSIGMIEIQGRVLDRDGAPVPDAMLEFWCAGDLQGTLSGSREHGIPDGFRRVATALDGSFTVKIARPVASRLEDGRVLAPHAMVLVFARGLMRHLITRMYFEAGAMNDSDPILLSVPAERRRTLTARIDGADAYRWDVILQGAGETVFFVW